MAGAPPLGAVHFRVEVALQRADAPAVLAVRLLVKGKSQGEPTVCRGNRADLASSASQDEPTYHGRGNNRADLARQPCRGNRGAVNWRALVAPKICFNGTFDIRARLQLRIEAVDDVACILKGAK